MIERSVKIGRWLVEFYFATDGYDADVLLQRMYDFGATAAVLRESDALMQYDKPNTGFTFTNAEEKLAIVAIGPTSSGAEFVDTLSHEIHHLSVAIANELGIDLDSEGPAYLTGDTTRDLFQVVCELGCRHCR